MKDAIKLLVPGARIVDVCRQSDESINKSLEKVYSKAKVLKGVAFPTCVSVNNVVCHYSPSDSEVVLAEGDLVKIEMGAHIDGCPALVCHSMVVGSSADKPVEGDKADLLAACHYGAEAALRTLVPGNKNSLVTDTVQQVGAEFGVSPIEGMLSFQIERNELEGTKQIIFNPTAEQRKLHEECTFQMYESYVVDIVMSNGDCKLKDTNEKASIFRKNNITYQLKMKSSRALLSEVNERFGSMAFRLDNLNDPKKSKLGMSECIKHKLLTPFDVMQVKEGDLAARFMFTVLLMPNGPLKITDYNFDPLTIKTNISNQDPKITALLAQPVRVKQEKK